MGMVMTSLFSNREIAIGIWLIIFFAFAFTRRDVRKSFISLFGAFLKRKILFSLLLMVLYVCTIVGLLFHASLWQVSLLKDTLIWLFFSGDFTIMNLVTSNPQQLDLKKAIIQLYSFALIVELIIVPIIILVVFVDSYIRAKGEDLEILRITGSIQAIFGIILIIFTLINIISDYHNLDILYTLKTFFLPAILSISFLPFIYLFVLFCSYEDVFIGLKLGYKKSPHLKYYAKSKIYHYCQLSIKEVSRLKPYHLLHLLAIEDVDNLIEDLKNNRI
jgi:hypothetical protein